MSAALLTAPTGLLWFCCRLFVCYIFGNADPGKYSYYILCNVETADQAPWGLKGQMSCSCPGWPSALFRGSGTRSWSPLWVVEGGRAGRLLSSARVCVLSSICTPPPQGRRVEELRVKEPFTFVDWVPLPRRGPLRAKGPLRVVWGEGVSDAFLAAFMASSV